MKMRGLGCFGDLFKQSEVQLEAGALLKGALKTWEDFPKLPHLVRAERVKAA